MSHANYIKAARHSVAQKPARALRPANRQRALRAAAAVDAYIAHAGDAPDESHFRDLLGDMMHLADMVRIDFAEHLRMARAHYDAEQTKRGDESW